MTITPYANYFMGLVSSKEKLDAIKAICKLEKINQKANERMALNPKIKNGHYNNALSQVTIEPINKLKKILSMLTETSANIIQHEFLENLTCKEWIDKYFSRATYYKRRKEAIEEFLFYYFNALK